MWCQIGVDDEVGLIASPFLSKGSKSALAVECPWHDTLDHRLALVDKDHVKLLMKVEEQKPEEEPPLACPRPLISACSRRQRTMASSASPSSCRAGAHVS